MATYQVLNTKAAQQIRDKHKDVLIALSSIQSELKKSFADMDEPITALSVSVLSGEPLLFVGKPGTAKSNLIRRFCEYIGVRSRDHQGQPLRDDKEQPHSDYFEYLLTPFTEPSELFGYFNILEATKHKHLVRDDQNMMQKAKVVYLDEVFNGSSAILNSLLAFMNERIFHDRGHVYKVEMESLFAATNIVPETSDLRAVFDRFLLRCEVSNVQAAPDKVNKLLQAGWNTTFGAKPPTFDPKFLTKIKMFRESVKEQANLMNFEDIAFAKAMSKLIGVSRSRGLSEVSNRRLIKFQFVLATHAIYRAARDNSVPQISSDDLKLWRFILDRRDPTFDLQISQEI